MFTKNGWSVDDITWIIRIISMVVIFIPVLLTWRGIFQGYKSMGPTAVSEVTEQIARVIFILIGSYLVLNVFDGSILLANGIATFQQQLVRLLVYSHSGITEKA